PEAQIDRFLFKVHVSYPDRDEEKRILDTMAVADSTRRRSLNDVEIRPVVTLDQIREARSVVDDIYMDEKVKTYILDLVYATRNPDSFKLRFHSPLDPRASLEKVIQ